jgi:phosphate starvation-inducible PhoH-like protein
MSKKHKKTKNNKLIPSNSNPLAPLKSSDNEYIKTDTSPYVYQKSKLKSSLNIRVRPDLTEKQKDLLRLALDKNVKIIFMSGPAGCSKTFIAVMAALKLLSDKKVSDILYLRSVVENSDRSLGYLKGTIDEKVSVYLTPLLDKLDELLPKQEIDMLIKEERISGQPINFIRGAHWAVKSIILDEAQNASYREIYTLLTRLGEHSKLFILGDTSQSDINNSGFESMMDQLNDEECRAQGIHAFKFTEDDVVRSELVKFLLKKLK